MSEDKKLGTIIKTDSEIVIDPHWSDRTIIYSFIVGKLIGYAESTDTYKIELMTWDEHDGRYVLMSGDVVRKFTTDVTR